MELYEALSRVNEICTGEKEQEAFDRIQQAMETYRSMYEGAEKRLMRYRDIAAKPDLCLASYNKDRFTDKQTALRMYETSVKPSGNAKPFLDWLFSRCENSEKGES